MTTQDQRFQQGQEIRARFGGGTVGAGSVPAARDIAPDLNRILGEFLFGSIWPRPALKAEQREMSTLSVLTVLQRQTQLKRHLGNALNLGLTPEQIVEVLIHMVWYGGAPATLNGLGLATEVFAERGINFTPQPVYDPTEDLESVYQRGVARRNEYMGQSSGGAGRGPVTNAEREFTRLTGEYYWGSVWTRPGLDLQSRSICTLSALTVLGREGPLSSHVPGRTAHRTYPGADYRGVHAHHLVRWTAFHPGRHGHCQRNLPIGLGGHAAGFLTRYFQVLGTFQPGSLDFPCTGKWSFRAARHGCHSNQPSTTNRQSWASRAGPFDKPGEDLGQTFWTAHQPPPLDSGLRRNDGVGSCGRRL